MAEARTDEVERLTATPTPYAAADSTLGPAVDASPVDDAVVLAIARSVAQQDAELLKRLAE